MSISKFIVSFHRKKKSITYKVISLLVGASFFMVILPFVFITFGSWLKHYLPAVDIHILDWIIVVVSMPLGLFFLIWSTWFQWKVGKGTPAPNASTDKLVVTGPYKLCRNPIELGALFYYLGLGTLVDGLITGSISMILVFIIGSLYHKFIEEKELQLRFGKEYEDYKKKTPFLFPKLWN